MAAMRSVQIFVLSVALINALPVDDAKDKDDVGELHQGPVGTGSKPGYGNVGGPGPNPGPHPGYGGVGGPQPWPSQNWNQGLGWQGNIGLGSGQLGYGGSVLGVINAPPSYQLGSGSEGIRFKLVRVGGDDDDDDDPIVKHYEGKEIVVRKSGPWGVGGGYPSGGFPVGGYPGGHGVGSNGGWPNGGWPNGGWPNGGWGGNVGTGSGGSGKNYGKQG
ncbi:hypothetical protein ACHWQZ_G004647 [Mnemiopsis leidyi]